jgi:hypothetical protein
MVPVSAACAMELGTGNPDMSIRWDNTVRYNLGMRVEGQDPRIANSAGNDESDRKFDRHDIVANRLDLLSEVDAVYQGKHGFRLSGAGWYDHAYRDNTVTPFVTAAPSYRNNTYNSTTQRFYEGPSGELLDAFVFTNFELGDARVGARLGKHVVYWGEGLLIGTHAISYSQSPSDGRKAQASPGIETKEVFLPINQLSFNAQLTNELSVGGQYFLDWKPTRAPSGGTYLGNADFLGADFTYLPARRNMLANKEPDDTRGAFGLKIAYNLPENAKLGVYYRRFDDYTQSGLLVDAVNSTARFVHAEDTKLIGMSLGATVAGASVGFELSRRTNAPLQSGGAASLNYGALGARGTTYHMVLNAVSALPNLPIYETGIVTAELAYNRLDEVTANAGNFKGIGSGYLAGCNATVPRGFAAKDIGCATKDYVGIAMNVTPQWLQVAPGLDLSAPITVSYGLHGNSSNVGSTGNEGEYSYSVGLTAMYQSKHEFALRYQDRYQKTGYDAAGLASSALSNGSLFTLNDRAYVSFTYKTSF